MIFDCFDQVAILSTVFTLEPGDIISTRTCSGVGVKMISCGYLKVGDRVRIEIDGIGYIENAIIEESADTVRL